MADPNNNDTTGFAPGIFSETPLYTGNYIEGAFDITQEDIDNSPRLQQLGVVEGDQYTLDEQNAPVLNRLYTKEGARRSPLYRITQEDIDNSPNLQKLNAEVDDAITLDDNRLIKTGSNDFWKQFAYGSDATRSFTADLERFVFSNEDYTPTFFGKLGEALGITEEAVPIIPSSGKITYNYGDGFGYATNEQLFGPEYNTADAARRRQLEEFRDQRELRHNYGPYFLYDPTSTGALAGNITTEIIDPISATPLGRTFKKAVGIGAAAGAGYKVAEDLSKPEGFSGIDPVEVGMYAAGGGALGGAMKLIPPVATGLYKSSVGKLLSKKQDVYQRAWANRKPGVSKDAAHNDALNKAKMTEEEFRSLTIRNDNDIGARSLDPLLDESRRNLDDKVANDLSWSRKKIKGLDVILGSMKTRLENLGATRVAKRINDGLIREEVNNVEDAAALFPFMKANKRLTKPQKQMLKEHMLNGDKAAAMQLLNPGQREALEDVYTLMNAHYLRHIDAGLTPYNPVKNYIPRRIKDLNAFYTDLAKLNKKSTGLLEQEFEKYAAKIKVSADDLDDFTKEKIIARTISSYENRTGRNFFGKRAIGKIPPELLKHYEDISVSLPRYIRQSNREVSKRNIFRQDVPKGSNREPVDHLRLTTDNVVIDPNTRLEKNIRALDGGNINEIDYGKSIQNLIREEIDAGRILEKDQSEVVSIIKSILTGADKNPKPAINFLKGLGYAGTIANPLSAIKQAGDLANPMYKYGFEDSILAATSPKYIKAAELGIKSAQYDMQDGAKMAQILQTLFKYTGFSSVDILGKETILNAAFRVNNRMVQTTKGVEKFKKKFKNVYPEEDEMNEMVAAFQAGKNNSRVREHLAYELADVQPFNLINASQAYANNPDLRILYMLKSFTLKQYDIVRKDIYNEAKKGTAKGAFNAARNMTVLTGYLAGMNLATTLIIDFIKNGFEFADLDEIPSLITWGLMGVYSVNKYNINRIEREGNLAEVVIGMMVPNAVAVDSAISTASSLANQDEDWYKNAKGIPGVGWVANIADARADRF